MLGRHKQKTKNFLGFVAQIHYATFFDHQHILLRTVRYAIRADKEIKSTVPYRENTLRSTALHYKSLD